MRGDLEEFAALYAQRPIRDNPAGMKAPHLFASWFVLKTLRPKAIVESGVYQGLGTWFFERACPEAELHCIDVDLGQLRYRSERARYYDRDFATWDWSALPKAETVLFFDDHQNAYARVQTVKWFGLQHVLFEDNFPPDRGDCYSLKMAFAGAGFSPYLMTRRRQARAAAAAVLGRSLYQAVPANEVDARYLYANLDAYCELPPVFQSELNLWGDRWEGAFPTPEPLLTAVEAPYQQVFLDEARAYHFICYARLKA